MKADTFRWPVRVYYEDTDAGGVVYHGAYVRFFERARTERLRAMGFEQDELRTREGIVFAVKSMNLDFIKPARFNDLLWVDARLVEAKRASLVFEQEIRRQADAGELLCKTQVRVACLEADAFKATAIPDYLLQRIKDEF
ncbi:tol-pal system-associated acyl-CoA thioesterase [Methylogaea oryzae]|uniref:Tol-pal system-associated acyl-CoA thioesterase n=1 Tax=Methylogaea oryzae TaxID=1295382 RepID=A0A8D5AMM0_9GAMM|nr:tol-pal system-associated acyl-CoA thioesterase [Methylogaea oryzae]BBL71220.1 tol-pal system-associated acyl-CoA thioesterase [Methylogaea oryzae]